MKSLFRIQTRFLPYQRTSLIRDGRTNNSININISINDQFISGRMEGKDHMISILLTSNCDKIYELMNLNGKFCFNVLSPKIRALYSHPCQLSVRNDFSAPKKNCQTRSQL